LPAAVEHFFNLRYGLGTELDEKHILRDIAEGGRKLSFSFKEIEQNYKLIEEGQIGVIIPYDDTAREILRQAAADRFPLRYLRRLQRYSVSVYSHEYKRLHDRGFLCEIASGIGTYQLNEENMADCYDEKLGLVSGGNWNELII
jgi:CRISPR-associated endonuclease/helicase Cas3